MPTPTVPETITVHLGAPDSSAQNVTVRFTDYIKNVASSEIYPTWPESALRANIYAIISFALNRYYTEFYRSRGYDFDITSSTQYDQKFINNREFFENISQIVDEIFNDYVTKGEQIQPYFTTYCNGTTVTCDGLSQWGTVSLANEGRTPYEILQYYYGDDINIIRNAPISANVQSYPGIILRLGSASEDVRTIQRELNRIAVNYPSIPQIPSVNGIYDQRTQQAVEQFQRIFNLTPDGQVGKATWYKLKQIYNGVKGLSELYSEGITLNEARRVFPEVLEYGNRGTNVATLQYYLNFIGKFYDSIPEITIDGFFGDETLNAVIAFQRTFGINQDGIVGRQTWYRIQDEYDAILRTLPETYLQASLPYPGYVLTVGATGEDVVRLQRIINQLADKIPSIPRVSVDGNYGEATRQAVIAFQRYIGQPETGAVTAVVWYAMVRLLYEVFE